MLADFRSLDLIIGLLIDGDDPNVGQHCLANAPGVYGVSQDDVDPVAGENQSGDARGRVNPQRDGAETRTQDRGEKAAAAGLHESSDGYWFTRRDRPAHDRADQILQVVLVLDQVALVELLVRPGLPSQQVFLNKSPGRQVLVGDENKGFRDLRRWRDRDRILALVADPASRDQARSGGNRDRD